MNTYLVKGIYRTIWGEGFRTGNKVVGIRLAGCNLWSGEPKDRAKGEGACAAWCDADFTKGEPLSTDEVLHAMDICWPKEFEAAPRWCVLTGGEPMLQVDDELVDAIHAAGWKIALETNGTFDAPVLEKIDWLTVSPKLASNVKVTKAHELKVVIPGCLPPDPGWTDEVLELMALTGQYEHKYLTPQDPINPASTSESYLINLAGRKDLGGVYKLHLQRCVTFVSKNPDWKLGIQIHKHVGLP